MNNKVVVHKFPIRVEDKPVVEMDPAGRILTFGAQHGQMYIWALVDPEAEKVEREFQIASTGYPIRLYHRYVGTTQLHGGDLVFHLFEFLPHLVPVEAAAPEPSPAAGQAAPAEAQVAASTPEATAPIHARPLFQGPSV